MRISKSIALLAHTIFLFLVMAGTANSQNYKMQSSSDIVVEGTSNIHDWEMEATSKMGGAVLETDNGKITGIKTLKVTVPAESLKSGKGGMDKNAYKALKTDKNKNIEFSLDEVKNISANGDTYKVSGLGTLKVAGVSKTIPLEFTAKQSGNNLKIEGEKTLNMTDYNVDPPTAMFGTITTGEEVTVKFNSTFIQ